MLTQTAKGCYNV